MKILSRVCAEFKDKKGNVVYRIGPADRLVYLDDAPEAIFPVKYRSGLILREYCNLHGLWAFTIP